jgi:fumarate reductase flavoprotein subunit
MEKRIASLLLAATLILGSLFFASNVAAQSGNTCTADVIIVGAGGTGMTAAIEAADAGASVIVLEKASAVGGNTLGVG